MGLSNHSYQEGVVKGMWACWGFGLPSSLPPKHMRSPSRVLPQLCPPLCALWGRLPLQSGALPLLAHLSPGAGTLCVLCETLGFMTLTSVFSEINLVTSDCQGWRSSFPPHESGHTPWVR